jgi:hypothetical protein
VNGKEVGVGIETGECMAQCTVCEVRGLECDEGYCCAYCVEHNIPRVRFGGTQCRISVVAEGVTEEKAVAVPDPATQSALAAQLAMVALPNVATLPDLMVRMEKTKHGKRTRRAEEHQGQRKRRRKARVAILAE